VARLCTDFFASTPKDPQHPELNEDAWLANDVGQRWALSDGASESYDSRAWALALVARYVDNPAVDERWVEQATQAYAASVDVLSLSWAKQAAYERGSFGTLLGVELAPNGSDLEVLAIGDSLAVHVRNGQVLGSYPFQDPASFANRPQLLSTLPAANAFVREPDFVTRNSSRTWAVEPGDHVYLMTDAVGQWLLDELAGERGSLGTIEQLKDPDQFDALVLSMRAERRLKLDDSTLVRLVVEP
jgi:hypothetical protein